VRSPEHQRSAAFLRGIQSMVGFPVSIDESHSHGPAGPYMYLRHEAGKGRRERTLLTEDRTQSCLCLFRQMNPPNRLHADSFSLTDILQFGTLPGVYGRSPENKTDILRAYADTCLTEEIQAEALVRSIGGFSRFLELAASQFGELVSYTAIGRECQVPTRSVQSYYEILEDTLVGLRLQAWSKSPRKRLVSHPEFYLFDLGVTNSLNRQLTAPPDPVRTGRLFEQWMVLETYRMANRLQGEAGIYFWRTNHGAEVDLIIEKHGRPIAAFETKTTSHVSGSHLSGLRAFREDHPDVRLHVIAQVDHPFRLDEVLVLPWKTYLQSLRDYL